MKARGPAAQAGGIFVKQVLSDEKTVWRDPGDLEPVYDLFPITNGLIHPARGCDTKMHVASHCAGRFSYGESPRISLTDETTVWRETLGDLEPVYDCE